MRALLLSALALILVIPGCKEDTEPVTAVEPTLEDLVIQNCHITKDAADAFAAQNGSYPAEVSELQPFLPNGEMLTNPFTDEVTEPWDGVASSPGWTGYQPIRTTTEVVGYNITGFGEFDIIIVITFDSRNP